MVDVDPSEIEAGKSKRLRHAWFGIGRIAEKIVKQWFLNVIQSALNALNLWKHFNTPKVWEMQK